MKNILFVLLLLIGKDIAAQAPSWEWARRAGGSFPEFGRSMCVDAGGNIIVTGGYGSYSITFGTFTLPWHGGQDVFITKYDANGNVIWAKGPGGNSYDYGSSVCADLNGNFFVAGNFQSAFMTFDTIILNGVCCGASLYLAKYDINGNALWARTTGWMAPPPSPAEFIAADVSGNVYVTGQFGDHVIFGNDTLLEVPGAGDMFIGKYDANGIALWGRSAIGIADDGPSAISTDNIGNVFVTGYFKSPTITFGSITLTNSGTAAMFIVKYDPTGNVVWASSANSSDKVIINSITTDPGGNVFITGNFTSPSVTFGSVTLINANSPLTDMFIVKYNNGGSVLWAKRVGGTDFEYGNGISTDASGNALVTGSFYSSSVAFDSYILNNYSSSSADIFVTKYDPAGNVLWAKSVPAVWDNDGRSIATDSCYVYITGDYNSLSMNIGNDTLNNSGYTDVFVAKLSCDAVTGIAETNKVNNLEIYPNPANDIITIKSNITFTATEIILFDASSREVLNKKFNKDASFSVKGLSEGIYFYKIKDVKGNEVRGKVVKE